MKKNPKSPLSFRAENWLSVELTNFMASHEIKSTTKGMHEYISSLKKKIEKLKKDNKMLRSSRTVYKQERKPAPSFRKTTVAAPKSQAPKVMVPCPHYAKEINQPEITQEQCRGVQEHRPDLCRAVSCPKFLSGSNNN